MITSVNFQVAAITGIGGLLIGALLGVGVAWKLYQPEQVVETYKPELRLDDDIIVLQRLPDQPPPKELVNASKKLNGKLTRTATIKLQPKPSKDSPKECKCDEISVDIGLVDDGSGNRLVARADDQSGATITGGTDNPLVPYTAAHQDKWDVGIIVPVAYPEGTGPSVARHIGPFKLGVAAARDREQGWTGFVTASISF